jgi:hypothetical protein
MAIEGKANGRDKKSEKIIIFAGLLMSDLTIGKPACPLVYVFSIDFPSGILCGYFWNTFISLSIPLHKLQ